MSKINKFFTVVIQLLVRFKCQNIIESLTQSYTFRLNNINDRSIRTLLYSVLESINFRVWQQFCFPKSTKIYPIFPLKIWADFRVLPHRNPPVEKTSSVWPRGVKSPKERSQHQAPCYLQMYIRTRSILPTILLHNIWYFEFPRRLK